MLWDPQCTAGGLCEIPQRQGLQGEMYTLALSRQAPGYSANKEGL